mmetsp:Transcript_31314/g.72068  ORF Transcript_31314/g.72068 Transcript_31314/m.72068 type:complete len:86 (-) Transcript_31314:36-293(-)
MRNTLETVAIFALINQRQSSSQKTSVAKMRTHQMSLHLVTNPAGTRVGDFLNRNNLLVIDVVIILDRDCCDGNPRAATWTTADMC